MNILYSLGDNNCISPIEKGPLTKYNQKGLIYHDPSI